MDFRQRHSTGALDKNEAANLKTPVIFDDLYVDACADAFFSS